MDICTEGVVCATLSHGEHNAIVRLLAREHGMMAGYVRGARGRQQRSLLIPGNKAQARWRGRAEDQLGAFTLELQQSYGLVALGPPLVSSALLWVTTLCAAMLPERQPYPTIYDGLEGFLTLLLHGAEADVWAQGLVRFELGVLTALGFGLDLGSCSATGTTEDLVYVSPKSAQAVSRAAGRPYHDRLLSLPRFLVSDEDQVDWPDVRDAFRLAGYFLEKQLYERRSAHIFAARHRILDLLERHHTPCEERVLKL